MSLLTTSREVSGRSRRMAAGAGRHQPSEISPAASSAPHSYRPEIDGLRAIAVIAVIAEHFSSALLPGGYLGVDVFFVISGFVISSSLASRSRSFAERVSYSVLRCARIKRLLPALVLCVLTTAVVASMFIDAHAREYETLIMSGAWSLLGVSNIYFFAKATNYFATASELNPFAHTWSLGVEEQFYLLYPTMFLLLSAGARSGSATRYFGAFALIVVLSMTGFLLLLDPLPSASYFLMPMRFWELGIGSLTYFFSTDPRRAAVLQREWIALGALIVLGACFCMPVTLQSAATVLTVASAAVLIASLRSGLGLCAVLSLRPIVSVGITFLFAVPLALERALDCSLDDRCQLGDGASFARANVRVGDR